jgi:hypothetical protein
LIFNGIPVLRADLEKLKGPRQLALEKGCDVVDFPKKG